MDKKKIEKSVRLFLEAIGEDPDRAGLKDTPRRVAEMCEEIYSGIKADPSEVLQTLIMQEHDEIILVKDIPIFSVCEHHLLPFIGKVHIAYIPEEGRVTGISKLVRTVEIFSRRLQIQERLSTQIADAINKALKPRGVMVVLEAEHLCLTMRGVKKQSSKVVTSVVRGIFRRSIKTRSEALSLIYSQR